MIPFLGAGKMYFGLHHGGKWAWWMSPRGGLIIGRPHGGRHGSTHPPDFRLGGHLTAAGESFIYPGYRDDGHLRQRNSGPYRHHRGRVIGVHDFSVGNVHGQFLKPIMRALGARIHDAPGNQSPTFITRASCVSYAVLLGGYQPDGRNAQSRWRVSGRYLGEHVERAALRLVLRQSLPGDDQR
jgi:hypothetical protein